MYSEKIDRFIDAHKDEMIEDIKTLCRIDSSKDSYRAGMPFGKGCFEVLHEALRIGETYGFSISNYDNYVAAMDLNEKERQLDILAHLDVVPAGDGWTVTEPFEPVVKDGNLYGRGVSDDKGPAVAALYAMRAVKELGIPLKKNVRLILGTDEECGSSDIAHYYSLEKEAPMTFSPDAEFPVINIEKGRFHGQFSAEFKKSEALPRLVSLDGGTKVNMVPSYAEALVEGLDGAETETLAKAMEKELGIRFDVAAESGFMKIAAYGANGHASTPEKGKNALTGLLALIARLPLADCEQTERVKALNELMPHGDWNGKALGIAMEDELSGNLTLAFSMLHVGEDSLSGAFDSRCPICSTEENTLKTAKKAMAKKHIRLETESMDLPHHVDGNSDFVRTLLDCYEQVTGEKGECLSIGGLTYVHDLKNGVAFGAAMPGVDSHAHGADECIPVEDLLAGAKIYARAIAALCG